jgi:hypothetical protein
MPQGWFGVHYSPVILTKAGAQEAWILSVGLGDAMARPPVAQA